MSRQPFSLWAIKQKKIRDKKYKMACEYEKWVRDVLDPEMSEIESRMIRESVDMDNAEIVFEGEDDNSYQAKKTARS